MQKPSIYNYFDYRCYLQDIFAFNKSINKKFTHRYIVGQIQASSSGWVSDLLKGRINITPMFKFRLAELLSLSSEEYTFFEDLIQYNQASTLEEKQVFFKRLVKSKTPEAKIVYQHQFDFYRIWYISALRELLIDYNFDGFDFAALASIFTPPITEDETRYAFKVLLESNLIIKVNNFYKPTSNNIKKDTSVSSFYWKSYMESFIKLSLDAIEKNKSERDISAVTLNFSTETFHEAQCEIAKLRKKLLAISEHSSNNNRTFQCNLQLFPLTMEF